ncbi:MAG: M14 family zinc carboxypeptidase [Ignavibacteria bacterium]|nr:M14 family zinc carboxypeptidase [Ignavibacteria bacterium]
MSKLILSLFLLLTTIGYSQSYKQIKISFQDRNQIEQLAKFDVDVEHAEWTKNNELILFVNEDEFSKISLLNFKIEILIDNWADYFAKLPKMSETEKSAAINESRDVFGVTGFGYGSLAGYYTVAEVNAKLDSMKLAFPNLITTKQSIGNTVEGRPMYMVKISDNPDVDEDEPEILYTAMIHAREPQAMMQMIYYMYYLLENYGTNPEVTYIVNNRELFFIPVLNPDGYYFNQIDSPTGGGMWRKNRKNNSGTYGIDLNRNFGPQNYWNAPNGGSSTTPSSETYRGIAPFSEPETQNLRDFVISRNFKNALNYHTYSNLLIYPYGALSMETPDSAIFREYANDMVAYNGYQPGTDMQTVGYSTRGNSDDYMYDGDIPAQGKIFAMTPEVGSSSDGFWPAQNRIFPLAQENVMPNLYYAYVAGEYVKLNNVSYDRPYFNPGDQNVEMNIASVKNKGLGDAVNLTIQLESLDQFITVNSGTINIASLPARSSMNVSTPFTFSISPIAPIDYLAKLLVKVSSDGTVMSTDTIKIILGTPNFAFVDTTNNPTALWTITATPATQQWGATTSSYYSAPNSYTDSPIGNYLANATVSLTSTNPINLSGLNNPRLAFWTKWDIEEEYDCGVVLASSNNGSTWTPLTGQYTKPASGSGKQTPAGMPMYDGLKTTWVREEFDMSSYAGQQIKLRFELRTDGSVQEDGWYIDDIGIYTYGAVPVELSAFSANIVNDVIKLQWKTLTETNNSGFYIERTNDNVNWNSLGFIKGNGTTVNEINYSFEDKTPGSGKNVYRLRQVDFDGTIKTAGIVEVDFNVITEYNLEQNYPNPFNPSTMINFQLAKAGFVTLKIYDLLGREVTTLINKEMEPGKHSVEFSTIGGGSNLSSGTYFYELSSGDFRSIKKFVLMK